MALEMIKNNLMLPWAQAAKGFQAIKSPTKFQDGPFIFGWTRHERVDANLNFRFSFRVH